MKPFLSHLQVNIDKQNLAFYKDLLVTLGWSIIQDTPEYVAGEDGRGLSMWFMDMGTKPVSNNYDGPGVNHISFGAELQADVDTTVSFLEKRGIERLFATPRHRHDFYPEESGKTYYQVMFESPDKILFEVVYIGDKTT
jgi:catechol 2,3-dioxygenase-like lactoylglutathione lyase family enzyme